MGLKITGELGKIHEYDNAMGLALFTGKTERLHQKNLELEFDAQVFHQGFDAEIDRMAKSIMKCNIYPIKI